MQDFLSSFSFPDFFSLFISVLSMLMLLGMSVDLWEEWVLLMIGKLIKSWVQFVKRMQKEGEEFAKSIKVSFTKEVAAWRLDWLDAVQQLEMKVKIG